MRVAVIGSRGVKMPDLAKHLPEGITAIIPGGARGADAVVRKYARQHGMALLEIPAEPQCCGRDAAQHRSDQVVEAADYVLAFWDGFSHDTAYVIKKCIALEKPYEIHICAK